MTNGSSSSAWQDICSSLIFCSRTADESIGQVRDSLTQRLYHFDEHATIALPFDHETLNHQLVPPISATVTRMCLQRLLAPLCEAWGLLDGLCRRVRRDLAVEGGFRRVWTVVSAVAMGLGWKVNGHWEAKTFDFWGDGSVPHECCLSTFSSPSKMTELTLE